MEAWTLGLEGRDWGLATGIGAWQLRLNFGDWNWGLATGIGPIG